MFLDLQPKNNWSNTNITGNVYSSEVHYFGVTLKRLHTYNQIYNSRICTSFWVPPNKVLFFLIPWLPIQGPQSGQQRNITFQRTTKTRAIWFWNWKNYCPQVQVLDSTGVKWSHSELKAELGVKSHLIGFSLWIDVV